jgi:hypothetical protein
MPKTAAGVPAVLPEAGQATATVLARIDLNGAFEYSSQFPLSRCCDDRLNSPNTPLWPSANAASKPGYGHRWAR